MATKNKIAADAIVLADDVADAVVEVATDVQAQAVEVVTVVKNNPVLLAGTAVVALGLGGLIGYKFAEKKLVLKFEKQLEEELEASKKFLKSDEFSTVDEAAAELLNKEYEDQAVEFVDELDKKLVRSLRAYNQSPVRPEQIVHTEKLISDTQNEVRNVFVNGSPINAEEWGDNEEVDQSGRGDETPYMISFNEYHSAEAGVSQAALTYYQRDDTLADENDQTIDDIEATVGIDNLDMIRHGIKATFYVRNPRTEMEFEVARYDRSYAETVLGLGEGG